MKAAARVLLAVAMLGIMVPGAVAAEPCVSGGLPGLAAVASKLRVRPAIDGMLSDCAGNAYPVGALLLAAVLRIEKAEKDAADARTDAARAIIIVLEKRAP